MKTSVRIASLGTTAVVAGLIAAFGAAGAASAAEADIRGEGNVTLNFSSTPGSVEVDVWTHSLSNVPAYGAVVIFDVDGTPYPFGPELYLPDEVKTYERTLDGYTCADLGRGAVAFAFGFGSLEATAPDWIGEPLSYPDSRITVIGCPTPNPVGEEPDPDPVDPPVVVPTDGGTTPVAVTPTATTPTATKNTLPAAKTDGAELAGGSTSSPLFGILFTVGALMVAAVGSMAGPLRRR